MWEVERGAQLQREHWGSVGSQAVIRKSTNVRHSHVYIRKLDNLRVRYWGCKLSKHEHMRIQPTNMKLKGHRSVSLGNSCHLLNGAMYALYAHFGKRNIKLSRSFSNTTIDKNRADDITNAAGIIVPWYTTIPRPSTPCQARVTREVEHYSKYSLDSSGRSH